MVHGDADATVPYQQSVALHKKYEEAGVRTQFMTIPGGKHGNFPKDQNAELSKAIIEFLKRVGVI
jgi:dipeptidyl aminopeptidase/acylaminoacyl peptidase